MVEFKKMFLNRIEAQRDTQNMASDMDINVDIPRLKKVNDGIEAQYSYTVSYKPKVGYVKMSGQLLITGEPGELNGIMEVWRQKGRVDAELARAMVNVITYISSVNGILVTKSLNLNPPMMPPDFKLGKLNGKSKKEASKTSKIKKKK